MMNDDERRRYDRAWNDPPMFTMDQMNKQPSSTVPLNKRYKYPVADQQMLNNQMYQQGNYMQNAYGQSAGYGSAALNQLPNQYSQQQSQSGYNTQNPSMATPYNQQQQISNAYAAGLQNLPGQPQAAYGYGGQQAQLSYANQQQLAQQQQQHYSPYDQQAGGHQLSNQSIISQQPLGATNQSANYQNPQTSAYLPNTINPTVTTAINQQQQIPVSNAMIQSNAYTTNPMQSNSQQQQQQQYNQQQLYNQSMTNQQYQLPNQYQY